ncbi:hypothetical protein VaNZ11_016524, partial [Volvox africanus]
MRRSALPLLLRLADAAPAQPYYTQLGQLTQLQALLLQATGHIGVAPNFLAQLPSNFSRALFGISHKDGRPKKQSKKELVVLGDDSCGVDNPGKIDSDNNDNRSSLLGAIHGARKHRRRSPAPSLEDITLLTLPRRSRIPRAEPLSAGPSSDPANASARGLLGNAVSRTNPPPPSALEEVLCVDRIRMVTPSAPTPELLTTEAAEAVPGVSQGRVPLPLPLPLPPTGSTVAATAAATEPRVIASGAKSAAGVASITALGQVGVGSFAAAETPLSPPSPASPASPPASLPWKPPPPPSPQDQQHQQQLQQQLQQEHVVPSSTEPSPVRLRPVARVVGPDIRSYGSRHVKSIHELLDDLEQSDAASSSPSAPPPPGALLESLEQWRKSRREGDPGRRLGGELAGRLDKVLAPRLSGEYGTVMEPRLTAMLIWSVAKSGLFGDAAIALADRLEESVRPEMPYDKDEYWASLALYSLGLAQQAAAAAAARCGSGSSGGVGGRWSSPAAAAAALVERSRRRLAPALLRLLSRNAATINQQALSNTFWAAGLLQLSDDKRVLAPLVAQAYQTAGEAKSQNISNILYGCAVLGLTEREWAAVQGRSYPLLERLVSETVRRKLLGFQPLEVSCVTWAACKLGLKSSPLLESVADFISRGGFEGVSSSQVWANTLYAMGLADFYDPRVFQKLSTALLESRPDRPPPPPSRGGKPPPTHTPGIVRFATAQTCCNLLFAMGALRHLDEQIVNVLLARMVEVVVSGRAAVVDVALAVRACAQLNYRSPLLDELLDAALPAMKAQAPRLMSYNVLWSMLILGMLGEPHHQPLVRHLVYCVNRYGTTTWKSPSTGAEPMSKSVMRSAPSPSGSQGLAYDDLTQLVQYHLESRYLGLTGEAYDLRPPEGMDVLVRQIRERRQELAAQSATVVHQFVVAALQEMSSSPNCVTAGIRHPRIVRVESEVMVEPELVVVDILLTLAQQNTNPSQKIIIPSSAPDLNSDLDSESVLDLDLDSDLDSGGQKEAVAAAVSVSDMAPTSTSAPTPFGDPNTSTFKLALEVDGPHHFMRNHPDHQDGPSAYRDRVLRRRLGQAVGGAGVEVIQTRKWVEQLHDDET